MAEHVHLDWFRERLAGVVGVEPKDPAPILDWSRGGAIRSSSADLIGLDQVARLVARRAGQCAAQERPVFRYRGRQDRERQRSARSKGMGSADLHAVGWRRSRLVARETPEGRRISPACQGRTGNIGILQLGPTIQSTWSNIGGQCRQAAADGGVSMPRRCPHRLPGEAQRGGRPVLAEIQGERRCVSSRRACDRPPERCIAGRASVRSRRLP